MTEEPTPPGWQPIETAPKDGTHFLCRWKPPGADRPETIIAFWNTDTIWNGFHGVNTQSGDGSRSISSLTFGFGGGTLYATHWRPLPTPPEIDNG